MLGWCLTAHKDNKGKQIIVEPNRENQIRNSKKGTSKRKKPQTGEYIGVAPALGKGYILFNLN